VTASGYLPIAALERFAMAAAEDTLKCDGSGESNRRPLSQDLVARETDLTREPRQTSRPRLTYPRGCQAAAGQSHPLQSGRVTSYALGLTIGLVAGYSRTLIDPVLMRGVDVLLAFPRS
jgi:hypothetical protein